MALELTRIDYGNIGTTLPNCLKLLPSEYKKQQKVAVGDLDGCLQVFSIKKSEAQVHFQNYVGKKISCVRLGGAPGSINDKVFVASENVVKGFNRKGKMFLSFDTNLTEPIKCMFVSGADLLICGNHVYSHYRDCKDIGTYLCGDTIVDVAALCPNNTNRILTILACSGRVIRILEHCRVRQTVELDSVPTTLHVPKNILGDRIFCGFTDGKIFIFYFGHFTGEIKQQVIIKPDMNPSAVTCIDTFDMTADERDELIIGRRDGTVQVFTLPIDDELDLEPRQLYRENFPESISAIQAGCVYSNGFIELVVLSYAGSIFSLTSQVINVSLTDKEIIREPLIRGAKRLDEKKQPDQQQYETEDEEVKLSLVKPQENYRLATQIVSTTMLPSTLLDVNDSIILDIDNAKYKLSIEMAVPIQQIILQSDASIELVNSDMSTAEITHNEIAAGSSNTFSIMVKLKENLNRFEMEFQTVEGQYGDLEALVMPNIQPKMVQPKIYLIRPLSLHIRIHTFDDKRPFNVLTLKGNFTQSEMHNWIEQCIPEVPERIAGETTDGLFFKNILIGTILECKYSKGNAQFRSDNLSTISVLKDFLTKEATKKRIKLEILSDISEPSVPHVIKLIEPTIIKCNQFKNDHKYLMALLEVDIRNDDDLNCLMPEYRSLLLRRQDIEKNFKKTPSVLGRYFGLLADFYIDRFKFKGIFVKDKIPELLNLLEKYNYDDVVEYFQKISTKSNKSEEILKI